MRAVATLALFLLACRFGGAGGDALALVEPRLDASVDSGPASPAPTGAGESVHVSDAALDASQPESVPLHDSSVADARADADAGHDARCPAAPLPVCDPVHNLGCTDGLTQCVLDPTSLAPAGHCVFSGPPATPCAESALSTTCPPQFTCVAGTCRKYCSCDTDCAPGETCSAPTPTTSADAVRLCISGT